MDESHVQHIVVCQLLIQTIKSKCCTVTVRKFSVLLLSVFTKFITQGCTVQLSENVNQPFTNREQRNMQYHGSGQQSCFHPPHIYLQSLREHRIITQSCITMFALIMHCSGRKPVSVQAGKIIVGMVTTCNTTTQTLKRNINESAGIERISFVNGWVF